MSEQSKLAEQSFQASVGQCMGAFNHLMSTKSLDHGSMANFVLAMQKQSQGLAHLARAVAELEAKIGSSRR